MEVFWNVMSLISGLVMSVLALFLLFTAIVVAKSFAMFLGGIIAALLALMFLGSIGHLK